MPGQYPWAHPPSCWAGSTLLYFVPKSVSVACPNRNWQSMSRYPIPAQQVRFQETISRSRFITTVAAAATPEQAHAFVAEIRTEFPDATHHCYAFVAGPPGSTARVGMSDDGEPGGTAGRPMLSVLLGSGVGDIVAVVTRFFGGTKLGTGGLVRAYSGGVKSALAQLTLQEKVARQTLKLGCAYHWISEIGRAHV